MHDLIEIPIKLLKKPMGFGGVNQLHTGSRGGDNYEKVNEETPVTKDSMCHLSARFNENRTSSVSHN